MTMDEYIERDAALAMVRPDDPNDERCAVTVATAKRLIRHALTAVPASDVALVTRCKDCRYLVNATVNANGFLICDINDMEIAPEDFCSYGEPKEG